jgi:hypothetical protein
MPYVWIRAPAVNKSTTFPCYKRMPLYPPQQIQDPILPSKTRVRFLVSLNNRTAKMVKTNLDLISEVDAYVILRCIAIA